MRKYILSFFVIIFFIGFSLYYRFSDDSPLQKQLPITPSSTSPTATPTQTTQNQIRGGGDDENEDDDRPIRIAAPPTTTQTPTKTQSNVGTVYKNGVYLGNVADAFYGNVQVQIVVSGGKITDVQFIQYPSDRPRSTEINRQALPLLRSEAIQAQNANVNVVSGATYTSQAFIESLGSAVAKAKS
jgi:uncharacterized protein with FMN-binding domain